ncbi:MAG: hypothetical protein ACFFD8_08290, partial [Candidatus Thorarchaeota archaeon]
MRSKRKVLGTLSIIFILTLGATQLSAAFFSETTFENQVTKPEIPKKQQMLNLYWASEIRHPEHELVCLDMLQVEDGFILLAWLQNSPEHRVWLGKTDPRGVLLWSEEYRVPGQGISGIPRAFCLCSDGGFAITGITYLTDNDYSSFIIRTSPSGELLWQHIYRCSFIQSATSIIECSNGDLIFTGDWNVRLEPESGYFAIRTDSEGNYLWNSSFELYYMRDCRVIEDAVGNILLAGATYRELRLISLTVDGVFQWSQNYTITEHHERMTLFDFKPHKSGGYLLTGRVYRLGYNMGGYQGFLLRTNELGEFLWNQTYGGLGSDFTSSVFQCNSSGYVLIGSTESMGIHDLDVWLIRTNEYGTLVTSSVLDNFWFFADSSSRITGNTIIEAQPSVFVASSTYSGSVWLLCFSDPLQVVSYLPITPY